MSSYNGEVIPGSSSDETRATTTSPLPEMEKHLKTPPVKDGGNPPVEDGSSIASTLSTGPGRKRPRSKKTKEELAKHAAANSKFNRVKGICKKVGQLTNSDRLKFNAFVVLHDLEQNKYTIEGTEDFVTRFKNNRPLVEYDAPRTYIYKLKDLDITPKRVVEPSPTKMPKSMASFTPGNRQLFDLRNAALDRGSSKVMTNETEPSAGASGIIGKTKGTKKTLKVNLGKADKGKAPLKRKYVRKSLASDTSQDLQGEVALAGTGIEQDDNPVTYNLDAVPPESPEIHTGFELINEDEGDMEPEADGDISGIAQLVEGLESEDEGQGTSKYEVNDWVAVIYDLEFWPGVIETVNADNGMCSIKFYEPIKGAVNKFSEMTGKRARDTLEPQGILCKLPTPPEPINNRGQWQLPLEDYININELMRTVLGIDLK